MQFFKNNAKKLKDFLRNNKNIKFRLVFVCLMEKQIIDSVGSISVLFSFSSSDISASNCDASHCSKYQDGGREALLLERITAGCNRPLDR